MIYALEKDYLKDDFIIKNYVNNININDKIKFNKEYIYYFGNYDKSYLKRIEKKLINNRKNIINAIEKGVKFLIYGNSIEIFNNSFKANKLNLFTCYDNKNLKLKRNKIILKNKYSKYIKHIRSLNEGSDNINFRYKNLICFNNKSLFSRI